MAVSSHPSPHLTLFSRMSERNSKTQVRLRLHIPQSYQQEPVISRLVSDYGIVVNITGAQLGANTEGGYFDLELKGTPQQIGEGLNYLRSLALKITGKPNAAGDAWFY